MWQACTGKRHRGHVPIGRSCSVWSRTCSQAKRWSLSASVASIQAKGARLAIPGVVDLSELAQEADGVARIVLEAMQSLLLRLALQMAREDYEDRRDRQRQGIELAKSAGKYQGRRADLKRHAQIVALRTSGHSIARTAELANCSQAQVKRVWAESKGEGS